MELVLIRHAQPLWSRERRAQSDPGLSELGRRQARLAARRLATFEFDGFYASTALRAQETAEPIAEALGTRPEDQGWLHEIRFPTAWDGTPAEEVGRLLRDARHRHRDEWWEGVPGGESFRDFHERVCQGLVSLLEQYGARRPDPDDRLWEIPDRRVRLLMVAHAGTNSVVLGHLLGLDPEPWEWERFASDHASLTVLRAVDIAGSHIFSLQRFSDVEHLDDELLSA